MDRPLGRNLSDHSCARMVATPVVVSGAEKKPQTALADGLWLLMKYIDYMKYRYKNPNRFVSR